MNNAYMFSNDFDFSRYITEQIVSIDNLILTIYN